MMPKHAPDCSAPPPKKGVAKKYISISLKILHKQKIITFDELANAFARIKLKDFHNKNQPPHLNPSVLSKGTWPSITGSHREIETRLSIFPIAISKCFRARTAFRSKAYQLIKVNRAYSARVMGKCIYTPHA